MRFADPSVCPSCAAPIGGRSSCSSCGLDLTTQPARELWQALLNADVLLERARATQSHVGAPDPPLPKAPPVSARAPRRSLSTGTILLALGALFVLVAGFIFITVSWGSLGVTGRALVLLAFTAVVGLLATFVTRRGLRGSAESLWAVFLGLVTLDWFAAWGEGLFGMDSLPFVAVAAAWAVVIFVVASFISKWAQPHVGRVLLVTPMVVAGVGPWVGAVALGVRLFDREDWNPFWSTVVAALFVGAFLLIALRMKHQLTAILLAVAAACGAAGAIGAALAEAFDHPSLQELAGERHGLSLVVVVLVAVGVGIAERRAALGAATVAMLGVTSLLVLPIESAHESRGAFVVISVVIVLAALVLRRPDPWSAGARVATGLLGIGLGLAALPWVGTFGSLVEESIEAGDGSQEFWARPTSMISGVGPVVAGGHRVRCAGRHDCAREVVARGEGRTRGFAAGRDAAGRRWGDGGAGLGRGAVRGRRARGDCGWGSAVRGAAAKQCRVDSGRARHRGSVAGPAASVADGDPRRVVDRFGRACGHHDPVHGRVEA